MVTYESPAYRADAPLSAFLRGMALWASSLMVLALSGVTV